MDITKVVIPAAGLGTRFLPYTKSTPKEMLPILNKPAIQMIVEEVLHSSINNFLIVSAKGKESLADYFYPNPHLQSILKESRKAELIADIEKIAKTGDAKSKKELATLQQYKAHLEAG